MFRRATSIDCTITLTMDDNRSVTINIPLETEGTDTNICPSYSMHS